MKQNAEGYWYIADRSHPFAMCDGYVPAHRLIMERLLGRIIDPRKEQVHHKDKNPSNNHPDNLELVSINDDHRKLDKGWQKIDGEWHKPCSECQGFLLVSEEHFTNTSRATLPHFANLAVGELCWRAITAEKQFWPQSAQYWLI